MKNRKILIIDDIKDNLISLKVLLKETFPKIGVITALSGKKGIKLAIKEEPDIILLDIKMPVMDGFEVCKILKTTKNLIDIPVVFVTALEDTESKIKALKCGGEGFLTKPIDKSELIAQIRAMLKIRTANLAKLNEKERLEKLVTKRTQKLKKELLLRKQIEKELKKSEELNKAITQTAADAIITINTKGLIMSWNKAAKKMFGFTSKEMIHKNLDVIIPIPFKIQHKNGLKRLESGGKEKLINKTMELMALQKNGTEFSIELSLSSWKVSNQKYYTGIVRDITERKRIEKNLIKSEERLSQIIENSKDWIWEMDTKGLYTYSNKMVENILGFKANEIVNKKYFYDFFEEKGKEKLKEIIFNAFQQKRSFRNFINRNISKNGDTVWISTSAVPMLNNNGNLIGYRGIDTDITKRKKDEQELLKAKEKAEESNRLKTEFLHNLSHEIRTPMNGILGFSQFLEDPNLTTKKRKYFISIMQNSGDQLLRVIDDILEISKLETKQVKVIESEVCLNDFLLELFAIFSTKAKENKTPLYLKRGLTDKQSVVLIDQTKLHKILSNLLENALKFTNEGFIEFGYKLNTNNKPSTIEIYVKDTGIGILKKRQKIIFERFSQAEKELSKKVGGLGLGLSIAKENAELLRGTISVESQPLKGATFTIIIPYKPVNKTPTIIDRNVGTQNKTILLIVEDEEVNCLYLETLINYILKLDYEIIFAKNGQEAIEICKSNLAIDLVLMDIKMPILGGIEATKQIKKFRSNLPIIAQTAYSTNEEKEKAIKAGCSDFISKPISKNSLLALLKKYIPVKPAL